MSSIRYDPPPNVYEDVLEFHEAMVQDQIENYPRLASDRINDLRRDLINEECNELLDALRHDDLEGILDGACDLIVVTLGTLIAYGLPFNQAWKEVHRTNMAKIDGPVRPDGKRLKPEGWQPPRIAKLIEKAIEKKSLNVILEEND